MTVIKFPLLRDHIRIVEQADADNMYGDIHPTTFGRRNGETFTDHGRGDLRIRPNDARFGDNPLAGPGEGASLDEFADDEITPQLDQLHQALMRAGLTDLEIRQGIDLSHAGKAKVAARLGLGTEEVDTLINSLTEKLRDEDASSTDALLSDYYTGMSEGEDAPMWPGKRSMTEAYNGYGGYDQYLRKAGFRNQPATQKYAKHPPRDHEAWVHPDHPDHSIELSGHETVWHRHQGEENAHDHVSGAMRSMGVKENERPFDEGTMFENRFSLEDDALGNATLRDQVTGEEKFLRASDASAVKDKLENGADPDEILAPLMEAEDTETSNGFADEIKADAGSYNFTWTHLGAQGTGTMLFTMKNEQPDLKLIGVRDRDGNDIFDHLDNDEAKSIMQQAKDFIGQE
jgi:hypothetical protein